MGRPIGSPNKDKPFRAALRRQASENPDLLDKIALKLLELAASGDVPAAREIGDRLDGKVPQAVVGDNEHPPVGFIVTGVLRATDADDSAGLHSPSAVRALPPPN